MFWMCIRIASVRRFKYTSTTYDFMEEYRNFSLIIILILTQDFSDFYYMLGGNLGSLLYGDVSLMSCQRPNAMLSELSDRVYVHGQQYCNSYLGSVEQTII